ncbi:protein kinase [Aureococcus anophagefferens]|nr:protein kinase [Aureococcus anophagefferens]
MRAWYSIIIFFLGGLAPKAFGQELAKLVASDAAEEDYFGGSVAVSGDLVVVGASGNDDGGSDSGSAYVFRTTNDGASWTQTAKLVASDAAKDNYFGGSVAVSGDLVRRPRRRRAHWNDDAGDSSGSAYVFRTTNGGASWTETAKLVASDAAANDRFGTSVAVSGDLVVVGADANDDAGSSSGSAYVFRTTNGGASWTQSAKLVASDAAEDDYFGTSVAVSGDSSSSGVAKHLASDGAEYDRFGGSVAISGDLVVVGAKYNGDAGIYTGSAYQMSANAAKLESGNADLVESKMRKLKDLLCGFKLAVDAFGREGWLKRAFLQHGRINSLTKLDKEITTCLESLKLDYKLAMDAEILERTYQMEQSIAMLVAKRCSETHEDPTAAAAILAQTPFAIAEVVENAHVPDDELLIEMREMNGEVRQGLAKILDSHRELLDSHCELLDSNRKMQQGHATLIEEVQKLTKWERARRLKNAHMEDNEIELDFVEVEPFAGGGQGSVHKAEYGGETVCLKKFLLVGIGAQSARDKIVSNFKKEVGIMDKLRKHPRTVDFVGICTTDASFLGIVTQYLPNGSLRGVLDDARGDAITPKMQFIWAKDIAIGMAYLHKEGVLHRDLKSQNVLLTNEWRCKIADFGISKSEALKTIATASTMRGGSGISGTFPFTAPEAFSKKSRFTTKCDVYSYAIVLWEIWDRGKPWDGFDLPEIYTAVCVEQERPNVPDLMPVEVRALMCRAWSQNAAARPDFEDIVTQLYIIEGKGL